MKHMGIACGVSMNQDATEKQEVGIQLRPTCWQDLRDRALRVIGYGSYEMQQEFLAEIDPDGYYPEATKRNGFWIHIARVVCTSYIDRDSDDIDIDGSGIWENSVQDDGPA